MDIKLICGDSATIKVAVVDGSGRPYDLKGENITAVVLEYWDKAVEEIKTLGTGCIVEGTMNIAEIWIAANDSQPDAGSYPYAITVADEGTHRYTILEGTLTYSLRLMEQG